MSSQIEEFQRILPGIEGSTATVRLVVDQSLINEFISANLIPRYPALSELRIRILPENQIEVFVRSTALFVPDVTVQLEIDPVAILDPRLAVRFRIRQQGFSKAVAWLLPAIAHKLPPFVRLSGETVVVDLGTLLEQWRPMLALLVGLEVQTSPEKLHVTAELRA